MHQQVTPSKQAAIAHYQSPADEARAYRAELDRNDRLIARAEVDQILQRMRQFDTSGCFAPSWVERAESAFKREFGAWSWAGALAVGVFFGFGFGVLLALVWGAK